MVSTRNVIYKINILIKLIYKKKIQKKDGVPDVTRAPLHYLPAGDIGFWSGWGPLLSVVALGGGHFRACWPLISSSPALVCVIPSLLPWQTHPTAPTIDVAGSSAAAAPTVTVAGSHTCALRPSLPMLLLLQLQLHGSFSCCRPCRQMDMPLLLTLHSPLLFVAPYL